MGDSGRERWDWVGAGTAGTIQWKVFARREPGTASIFPTQNKEVVGWKMREIFYYF